MSEFTLSTLRAVYIQNLPYQYPLPVYGTDGSMWFHPVKTGWQVIPNILWSHYVSPRQFYEMIIKYEAIKVVGCSTTVFNMIPIQDTVSIQGGSTFQAFNNTIYAWGYTDDIYETPPFNWYDYYKQDNQLYPAYKEGAFPASITPQTQGWGNTAWWKDSNIFNTEQQLKNQVEGLPTSVTLTRQRWPEYIYQFPFNKFYGDNSDKMFDYMCTMGGSRCSGYTGAFWDPLNRPSSIMELRPGKNAIKFSWNAHESDQNHWFNLDAVALLWPYPRDGNQNPREQGWSNYWRDQGVDPRNAGGHGIDPATRKIDSGTSISGKDKILRNHMQYPYDWESLPDWAQFPIVPVHWWDVEIGRSNLYGNTLFSTKTGNVLGSFYTEKQTIRQMLWPGTEYEQYKYPPTQWFMKTVPLFNTNNSLINVEAQVFYLNEIQIVGKERKSAMFAPTWGPFPPQNLYSADPKGKYNLSTIRGRSGGARRTWFNSEYPPYAPLPIPVTTASESSITVDTSAISTVSFDEPASWTKSSS